MTPRPPRAGDLVWAAVATALGLAIGIVGVILMEACRSGV